VLRGTQSNRDAIGARVILRAGQARMVQEVRSGSSYLSSSDLRLHFGLGTNTHVDALEVRWPNGETEKFPGADADRFLTLTEGTGQAPPSTTRP
jgi:enediyne biosynthesis protein E4